MKRKNLLRIIALVVLLSLVLSTAVFAMPPGQLKKLQRNDYNYNNAADYVKLLGIMKGYGNGDFGLEDFVKRGDIVVMIVRAFKLSMIMEKYQVELDDLFPDVDKDSYFAKDISVAKKLGIAKGNGKEFNPHKNVTIEEAILLIERSVEKANSNVNVSDDFDLRALFSKEELKNYAQRKDIALMLYNVLTGEEYDRELDEDKDEEEKTDLANIEYKIDEDEIQTLSVGKFTNALRAITSKALQYVMFEEIDNDEVYNLYYEYEDGDSKTIDDETKYYVNRESNDDELISKVSFVPDKNEAGIFSIDYKAYVDGSSYTGKIKITVNELDVIDPIVDKIYTNETITYDIEKIFNDETDEDFESVIFNIPNDEIGKLFLNYDEGNEDEIEDGDKYTDNNLSEITFVPSKVGLYEIIYTVTIEDEAYSGKISITVRENKVLKDITIEEDDFEVTFNFQEDILDEATTKEFEKVIFKTPDRYTEGILYNDYNGNNEFSIRNINYNISELDELTFMAKDDDTVNINYKVYDDAGNEYTGKIIIVID